MPEEWTGVETDLAREAAERTQAAVERARAEEALRESEDRARLDHRPAGRRGSVSVVLERRDGGVVPVVEDDGAGSDMAAILASILRLGLRGMRERVSLAGGNLTVESSPGPGESATLTVRVPLP